MWDGSAEQCLDVGLNLLGRDVGLVTANYLAVPADEELGEVPFHFVGAQRLWPRSLHVVIKWAVRRTEVARCLGTQMNIQGICQRPVDADLAGDVDDEQDLAGELLQGLGLARVCGHGELVNAHRESFSGRCYPVGRRSGGQQGWPCGSRSLSR